MKLNLEDITVKMSTDNNHNRENTTAASSKEDGEVHIGKAEFEMTPEEILEYIKTAPGIVKDVLAFAKDALAMRHEAAKEEAKKVVKD